MYRILVLLIVISACSQGPRGADPLVLPGDYPRLLPLDPILAQADEGSRVIPETQALQARAAFLKRKAAALRGQSLDVGQARLKALG